MSFVVYLVGGRPKPVEEALAGKGIEVLTGDGEFNGEMLARCHVMMPGRGYITKEILDRAPNLKLIVKTGVGTDRIDVAECAKRGIRVENTPYSNFISVAEHTVALMLAVAKQLNPIGLNFRRESAKQFDPGKYPSIELFGKNLALIGLGNIGLRVAKIASGFDMNIIGYARRPNRSATPRYISLADSMGGAVSNADFVSLHVSGVEENRGLIGAGELSLMKRTAVLINTTRGFVVDEKALYDALVNKRIAGAGLDVFEDEPLKPGNPLLRLENVVATPHSASNTPEARSRAFSSCAQIILDYAAAVKGGVHSGR